MKIKLLLLITMLTSLFGKAQVISNYNALEELYKTSDIIFEGIKIKSNPSFYDDKKQMFTTFDVKVTKSISNSSINQIIIVELEGGAIGMEESTPSHGYKSIPSNKTIFFLKKNARGNYDIAFMCDISNPDYINGNVTFSNAPYTKLETFYSDLSKISGQQLIVEKKSLNVKENEINNSIPTIPYEVRYKNYNNLIAKKTEQYLLNKNGASSKTMTQDVTLQVLNATITGTTIKSLEFDVNIKSSNSSSYLDNMPVWLTYNTAVFGTNIVAGGKVTVTNGSSFNNTQYLSANANMSDQTTNTFAFAVGTDYMLSNPVRVNITPTYKLLAHVKIEISNCGNATVNLSNASTALNAAFYTTTSTASSTSFQSYTSLLYNGSISNSLPCPTTILDFNSPIDGGLDQILTIKGYSFGTTRGNGQVKFRNADNFGFPYINKLNNIDYISWNDTLIKIKLPSAVDTIGGSTYNSPGTGNFKVVTNIGDSAISNLNQSSLPFSVYFSIYNTRPSYAQTTLTTAQKLKANLYKSNTSTGGYIIRLDTSISNYPDRKGCVIKAVKSWVCMTSVNIKIGSDTAMQVLAQDKICNMFFAPASAFPFSNIVADTKCNTSLCPSATPIRFINDFDIKINSSKSFFYDTTGATLPAAKIDFYEVMIHEIGHGIGLMHVVDSSAVMFYKTLGNQPFSISGSSRRTLVPSTTDPDGGTTQVATSLTNMTGQCGLQDMTQISSGSCTMIGIKELLNANFNIAVYPNPSTDGDVNISFDALENVKPKIEIYNLLGEKVIEENVLNNNGGKHYVTKLNLNQLSNGVYILNVIVDKNKASYKIVKQ